jgi:plasmid stabilization system protein ParE
VSFVVESSPTAEDDLERLFDFLLDTAESTADLDRAQAAIEAVRATVVHRLAITPFSFRKAAQNPAQRELIIPFGATGRDPPRSQGEYRGRGARATPFMHRAGRLRRVALAVRSVHVPFLRTSKDKGLGVTAKPLGPLPHLVGAIGLEPTTPTMSRWCSNQLSYAPESPKL